MNNSQFTTQELRGTIPFLISMKKGLTTSSSFCNENLIEFSPNHPIFIKNIDENKESVLVEFHQYFPDEDGFGEDYDYETIQSVNDIKDAMKRIG